MAHVYLDRDNGEFTVRVMTGAYGDKTTRFKDHSEAEQFAIRKMGKTGMLIDTTRMTPEQFKAHIARQERAKAVVRSLQ